LDEILPDADFLFLCIPSWYMEEALSEISLSLDPKTILISLSKGMNAISHQSMDVLIEAEFPENRYALLHGPMLAAEIIEDKLASAVVATDKKETYEEIASLFAGSKLTLEYSAEVHSAALAAVLKNIYTLVIGMLDGIGEGDNTKGYFISKSMDEMLAILEIADADMSTGLGVAGLGDFVATASSPLSTNRQVGEEIAKTGASSKRSEGLVSLPSVLKLVGAKKKNLPLLSLLERIIIENKDAKSEISNLLK
jgi:glycerol-3-phosphate dehydrogenase (NAD(P)+)